MTRIRILCGLGLVGLAVVHAYSTRDCTLRQNYKNFTCGLPGSVTSQDKRIGDPFPVRDLQECQEFASATVYDYSFSFDTSSLLCAIYVFNFETFMRNRSSTVYFYDYECFVCTYKNCSIPYNTNILLNSGFELPSDISAPWGQPRTKGGKNSSYAISAPFQIQQSVYPCPGYLYKLAYDYKIDEDNTKGDFYVTANLYGLPLLVSANVISVRSTQREWLHSETYIPFKGYEHLKGKFGQLILVGRPDKYHPPEKGTLLIDNVKLSTIDPAKAKEPKPGSKSVIVNGGFESGDLKPWSLEIRFFRDRNHAKVVSPGINSNHALEVFGNYSRRSAGLEATITQIVSTKPNTPYILTFDVDPVKVSGKNVSFSSIDIYVSTRPPGQPYGEYIFYPHDPIPKGLSKAAIPIYSYVDKLQLTVNLNIARGERILVDNFELRESRLSSPT